MESLYNFAKGHVGDCAEFAAPFALTFMCYVFFTTFIEIFGLPPATEDLNCTIALGLCSFIMVNFTALKFRGLRGRLKNLASPSAVVFPIKVLTDCIAPLLHGHSTLRQRVGGRGHHGAGVRRAAHPLARCRFLVFQRAARGHSDLRLWPAVPHLHGEAVE